MNQLLRSTLAVPAPSTGHGRPTSPWWAYLVGAGLIVVGLVLVAKPQLAWQMSRWQYKNPNAMEPSSEGLVMKRVSAGLMVIVGIVFIVAAVVR